MFRGPPRIFQYELAVQIYRMLVLKLINNIIGLNAIPTSNLNIKNCVTEIRF